MPLRSRVVVCLNTEYSSDCNECTEIKDFVIDYFPPQYVLTASEAIKKTAHWEVDVEVDFFHIKSGTNHLVSGLFNGKTLVYSDLHHVVLRIMPKFAPEAGENAILVSSHIDTVFSSYVST